MYLDHAITLVQARSCLAALADGAHTEAGSDAYERLLIDLDRIFGDEWPALEAVPDDMTRHVLFGQASVAIKDLLGCGINNLRVELLLAELTDAYGQDAG